MERLGYWGSRCEKMKWARKWEVGLTLENDGLNPMQLNYFDKLE